MLKTARVLTVLVRDASRSAPIIAVPKVSPYALFVKDSAKNVKSPINKENFGLFSKDTSAKWKAMSPADKEAFAKRSKELNEKALAEFNKKPLDERNRLEEEAREAKKNLARKRELRERREMWEKTGHPKMPANSFTLFVQQRLTELSKKSKVTTKEEGAARIKALAEEWNKMDDTKKTKWTKEAAANLKKYKEDVEKWKAAQPKESAKQ